MQVAIYARYSSELQRDTSIDDQIRLCEEYAARHGWLVRVRYDDRGASGAKPHPARHSEADAGCGGG